MHIAPCNGAAVVMVAGASKIYAICLHIFPSGISHSDARIVFFFSSLVNFSLRIKMVTFLLVLMCLFSAFAKKSWYTNLILRTATFLFLYVGEPRGVCHLCMTKLDYDEIEKQEHEMHSKLLAFRVLVFQFHHNLILSCM